MMLVACTLVLFAGWLGYHLGRMEENTAPLWRDKKSGIIEIEGKLYQATQVTDVKYNTRKRKK